MLVLNNVTSGYRTNVINHNFQAIQDYVNDNVLKRAGVVQGENNSMDVDLDMNGKRIINNAQFNEIMNRLSVIEGKLNSLGV